MKNVIIVSILFIVVSCMSKTEKNISKRIQYFESWSGYNHPIKPVSEIQGDKLNTYDGSYYIATYKNDKLISFEKKLDGLTFFEYKYKYNDLGKLESALIIDKEGVEKNIPLKGI